MSSTLLLPEQPTRSRVAKIVNREMRTMDSPQGEMRPAIPHFDPVLPDTSK
jgi:hypothetical protein